MTESKHEKGSPPIRMATYILAAVGGFLTLWVGLTRIGEFSPGGAALLAGAIFAISVLSAFGFVSAARLRYVSAKIADYRDLQERLGSVMIESREQLHELSSRIFGVSRSELRVTVYVNQDGTGKVLISERIRATIDSNVRAVSHSLAAPAADPNGPPFKIDDMRATSVGVETKICVDKATGNNLVWTVEFEPQLSVTRDVSVDYAIAYPPKMFARNQEELQLRGLQSDFYAMHIAYPTRRLHLEILFPEDMVTATLRPEVWIDPSGKVLHLNEMHRIAEKASFRQTVFHGRFIAELDVSFPIDGARYVIRWVPK